MATSSWEQTKHKTISVRLLHEDCWQHENCVFGYWGEISQRGVFLKGRELGYKAVQSIKDRQLEIRTQERPKEISPHASRHAGGGKTLEITKEILPRQSIIGGTTMEILPRPSKEETTMEIPPRPSIGGTTKEIPPHPSIEETARDNRSDWALRKETNSNLDQDLDRPSAGKATKENQNEAGKAFKLRMVKKKPYRSDCKICGKVVAHMANHLRIHTGERPFKCDKCTKCYKTQSALQHHDITHTGKKLFSCCVCKKRFGRKSECTKHEQSHDRKQRFPCPICNKLFKNSDYIKGHIDTVHRKLKPHKCSLCHKAYTEKRAVKRHMATVHTGSKNFQCDICGKKFSWEVTRNTHRKLHFLKKPDKVQCEVCNKYFATKMTLRTHMEMHEDEKQFEFKYCKKMYQRSGSLTTHISRAHILAGSKDCKCKICDKGFIDKAALRFHMKTHSEDRPYVCPTCGKAFKQKITLDTHQKSVHAIEKLFLCDVCDKAFALKAGRDKHLKTHFRNQSEKDFVCEICLKRFAYKSTLYTHLKIHQGVSYDCEFCNKTFKTEGYMKKHVKDIHTGSEQLTCDVCGGVFKNLITLKRHVKAFHTT